MKYCYYHEYIMLCGHLLLLSKNIVYIQLQMQLYRTLIIQTHKLRCTIPERDYDRLFQNNHDKITKGKSNTSYDVT